MSIFNGKHFTYLSVIGVADILGVLWLVYCTVVLGSAVTASLAPGTAITITGKVLKINKQMLMLLSTNIVLSYIKQNMDVFV